MVSPKEALRLILKNTRSLGAETVPLAESEGRVVAEDIFAREDLPPFDSSAMNGFAVRAVDCAPTSRQTSVSLKVGETLRAGALAVVKLRPGQAVKIMTGAPVPKGADAVVMKEFTSENGDGCVKILRAPQRGQHIRCYGEDVHRGELILKKGTLIRPYEIALLAAQGIKKIHAIARPRVAILATGDELVEASQPLSPGKIRNSNGPALAAALSRWGAVPLYQGIVPDDPGLMKTALRQSLESCDMLLASGGASVGVFDSAKTLLEEVGLKDVFWKAAIKPGKPLLFGLYRNKPVFGLPGNPISAMVCVEEFVRSAIEKMQGRSPRYPSYHLQGLLENDYPKDAARQQYLFCQASERSDGFRLRVIRPQGSAMLGMAVQANALAIAPIGLSRLKKGMKVSFRWLK